MLVVRLLLNMYLVNCAVVGWNNEFSSEFLVKNGVKQGGVLSPHLFGIYINPLIKELRESKQGCRIGGLMCNVFGYADDLILITPTLKALKYLIVICEQYGVTIECS